MEWWSAWREKDESDHQGEEETRARLFLAVSVRSGGRVSAALFLLSMEVDEVRYVRGVPLTR